MKTTRFLKYLNNMLIKPGCDFMFIPRKRIIDEDFNGTEKELEFFLKCKNFVDTSLLPEDITDYEKETVLDDYNKTIRFSIEMLFKKMKNNLKVAENINNTIEFWKCPVCGFWKSLYIVNEDKSYTCKCFMCDYKVEIIGEDSLKLFLRHILRIKNTLILKIELPFIESTLGKYVLKKGIFEDVQLNVDLIKDDENIQDSLF